MWVLLVQCHREGNEVSYSCLKNPNLVRATDGNYKVMRGSLNLSSTCAQHLREITREVT